MKSMASSVHMSGHTLKAASCWGHWSASPPVVVVVGDGVGVGVGIVVVVVVVGVVVVGVVVVADVSALVRNHHER